MKRCDRISHRFVDLVPDVLDEGVLYVSISFATTVHLCCCGCGNEVVTPLDPTDWLMTFDGKSVSLYPSIGNWSFNCQSHYWIYRNSIMWARRLSKYEIQEGRARDNFEKAQQFGYAPAEYAHSNGRAGNWASRGRCRVWSWLSVVTRRAKIALISIMSSDGEH